jgi:glycosyltransferase involved in cell wall biosynthesis
VHGQIAPDDWARVHFVGTLSRFQFTQVLQISSVHVYLTYPFVLSWSLLEAMSVECAIVASDTAPVQEFIQHDRTGLLTPFFDQKQLVDNISLLLDNPEKRAAMGKAAREEILRKYDLKTVCLPNMLDWVEALGRVSRDH